VNVFIKPSFICFLNFLKNIFIFWVERFH
jgi:hypothetical protein